ncbi:hypothetical protein AMATHDRAFT_69649 [Amanita thiersii Skay4041]|uniref:Aquaporin n=1 Tax=Amanita thiersii Skay4041 TaxID=703135 RepID=A0A2A9NFP8_9AGAR|nr:hypothetical protein AMATHDRAFT_69649 [Amanita thiersii Skay4041]
MPPTTVKTMSPRFESLEVKMVESITIAEGIPPRNIWSRIREKLREPFAEFLGVSILTAIGLGVNCQTTLSSNPRVAGSPKGDWNSVALGWGAGIALGVWVSGGISGGHINPAVTLAMATFRGFPWKKVPIYMLSQLLGGLVGAAIVYGNYVHAIDIYEGGRNVRTMLTAGLFATYPLDFVTNASAFFSEFLGAGILMIAVLAMCDKQNSGPTGGLAPLVLFVTLMGIALSLGMETGFGINPARDLGPRLLTSMVGYGRMVYNFRKQYWLWCSVIAPFLGAQAGALVYDALVYIGEDSILNKRLRRHGLPRNVSAEQGRLDSNV